LASLDRTATCSSAWCRRASWRRRSHPPPDEIEWAQTKTTTEQHFLALVVLLKCYQRLGYFPKLVDVPAVVVEFVRGKLELDQAVAPAHESDRTLWRHRDFVRGAVGREVHAGHGAGGGRGGDPADTDLVLDGPHTVVDPQPVTSDRSGVPAR
jgi:hypothetical protein